MTECSNYGEAVEISKDIFFFFLGHVIRCVSFVRILVEVLMSIVNVLELRLQLVIF